MTMIYKVEDSGPLSLTVHTRTIVITVRPTMRRYQIQHMITPLDLAEARDDKGLLEHINKDFVMRAFRDFYAEVGIV